MHMHSLKEWQHSHFFLSGRSTGNTSGRPGWSWP